MEKIQFYDIARMLPNQNLALLRQRFLEAEEAACALPPPFPNFIFTIHSEGS
jgi:hypothetical protein